MNRTVIPPHIQRRLRSSAARGRTRSLARLSLALVLAAGSWTGAQSIAWGEDFKAPTVPASSESPSDTVTKLQATMRSGDLAGAVDQFRQVSHQKSLMQSDLAKLASVRKRLVDIGIDPKLLELPPTAFKRLPKISDASPLAGNNASAGDFAKPGFTGSPVQQAGGAPSWANGGNVAQTGFDPAKAGTVFDKNGKALAQTGFDPTKAGAVPSNGPNGTIRPVQFTQELAPGGDASAAFDRGMKALTAGDKAAAREAFLEAWKNQDALPMQQRNVLKDKLTLLQPRRLGDAPVESDSPASPLEIAAAEEQAKTRRLYREVTSEMANIEQGKTEDPMKARTDLQALKDRVEAANVSEESKSALVRMVDRSITRQSQYIEANRADIELELENESTRLELAMEAKRREQIDAEVKTLVEQYNDLRDQQRFEEAQVLAKQVAELKPNSTIATTMNETGRLQTILKMHEETERAQRDGFITTMQNLEQDAIPFDDKRPVQFTDATTWQQLTELRRNAEGFGDENLSPAEREIKRKLSAQVPIKYRNRPLVDVLNDLSALTGVPIVPDAKAMSEVRVNVDTPITLDLNQPIQLKSALNLILGELELAYMIDNDVLMITSEATRRSKLIPKTYKVADLVTPIPNFAAGYEDGLAGALKAAYQMSMPQAEVQMMPVSLTDMAGGNMSQRMSPNAMNPSVLGQYGPMNMAGGFGNGGGAQMGNAPGGAANADFDSLIELIQTTIEPDTWEALGGESTMSEYRQNLSLVISTTSDVHDQIADLLESLRRLQNLQITIEVRFITLSDAFAENIGVDFDIQFDDNVTQFPTDDDGPSVTVGIDAGSNLTPDLDIRFDNNLATAPPFGATLSDPSSIGFAILSDIEAFFFLQATQADNRSNVMQAPKVTMFDGQIASINDQTQRPFVMSIIPVVGDFAVAQQPVIVVLNEGTQLNVQGIVSDDKRFVRLTLVPFFSQIGDVDTFTYEGRRSTRRTSTDQEDTNGDGVVDERDAVDTDDETDVIEGTTVQLPTFAFTTVSTTVSVPDGGTILLGGVKRLAEGRAENGVPMLSKIPYINRLFRNQAIGRDARSLMLMVTPRIIIQEEEELAQTGFDPENF